MARFIRGPFGIGFVNVETVRTVSDVYFETGPTWSGGKYDGWDYASVMVSFLHGQEQKYRKKIEYPEGFAPEERALFCRDRIKQHEEDLKKFLADLE